MDEILKDRLQSAIEFLGKKKSLELRPGYWVCWTRRENDNAGRLEPNIYATESQILNMAIEEGWRYNYEEDN
jgi:hypothetical protein